MYADQQVACTIHLHHAPRVDSLTQHTHGHRQCLRWWCGQLQLLSLSLLLPPLSLQWWCSPRAAAGEFFRPQLVRHSLAIRTCERLCLRVESKTRWDWNRLVNFKIKNASCNWNQLNAICKCLLSWKCLPKTIFAINFVACARVCERVCRFACVK